MHRQVTDRWADAERRLRDFEQAPGFIIVMRGSELVVDFVNEGHRALFNSGDWVGKPIREAFPSLQDQGLFERLDQVYATGESFAAHGAEARFARAPVSAHESRFLDLIYSPLRDDDGSISGIYCQGSDVTASYLAEQALRASEARLRELNAALERRVIERAQARGRTWEVTPDLMGALNADGYFETSNPAWMTVLGWTEKEVASMSIWELLHPDDLERTRGGFELTQIGQPAIRFPNRYRRKDGDYRWISWVGVLEDGYVYCTGRDITEERAAQAERDQLWTLSVDMLARANYAGTMSAVNPAWTKVLGWTERQLLQNPYSAIIHPDDIAATIAALDEMSSTLSPAAFENRIMTSAGSWKHIGWIVAPEADGVNFIAVGRDLSDSKAREAELSQAQEALRQSQKMEAVGQLTGGIAHDFNNMLAVVTGGLNLIERRLAKGESVNQLMAAVQDGAWRAADLVQRLLAFSRQLPLNPQNVDVAAMVESMSELMRRTLGERVHLETVIAEGLWKARTDMNQLENALLNLSINARDAMPGGGKLTIEASKVDFDDLHAREHDGVTAGQYVLIAVSDTGTGMPPETLERAYEPFFTTKAVGKGTGLGLSQVFGYVKQSRGHINIVSEVGRGTTVKIHLPRALQESEPEKEIPEATPTPRGSQHEVILLVEDEDRLREVAALALGDLGYAAIQASSGVRALEVLNAHPEISLLLTDVVMPEMSGRQLADAALEARPDLRILFMTGYARNELADAGSLDPGVNLLAKPFTLDQLGKKLREILG